MSHSASREHPQSAQQTNADVGANSSTVVPALQSPLAFYSHILLHPLNELRTTDMPTLIESLFDIVKGFFKAIFAVLETFVSLIQTFIVELLTLVQTTLKFTFRHFFVLAAIAAAFVGFTYFQQRNPQVRQNINQAKKKM
ncbi:uncharacterized protein JCM15063_002299 [Sporobolomyces koalae]|uniref:uncharacterized protein n=1 Tax=Sporobolomyces koalae TaxID=500713 RepID=UPI003175777F